MRTISHFINGQSVTRPGAITSPSVRPGTARLPLPSRGGQTSDSTSMRIASSVTAMS
jgi:hypothetical protein